jgi:hypothetical protein
MKVSRIFLARHKPHLLSNALLIRIGFEVEIERVTLRADHARKSGFADLSRSQKISGGRGGSVARLIWWRFGAQSFSYLWSSTPDLQCCFCAYGIRAPGK